ncbi:MAG: SusC/RagA family TonB-linked outer membrane protein [Tannerellaceae bacterium]|jgi:TonB-linked SusC/RagA family outer membrane protein|nr:SusC/RagA family TonB-linked outer membrane protein [Tannerellaceae bacterium]
MKKISLMIQILISLILGSALNVRAQNSRIVGSVTDTDGAPIIGAIVIVKGTSIGTVTNVSGNYEISTGNGAFTLVFSYIGYKVLEVEVTPGRNRIDVVLQEETQLLDELVVIGYGTVRKRDLTGSVAHVGRETIETKVATSVADFLKGSIAGVNININNDAQGGGSIQVRGPASLQASTSPLIVLDGNIYYGNISDINPNDIESIDVLKDASSTAIYGSKGSAGVIMVNTKRGQSEKPLITLSTKLGLSNLRKIPPLPTPNEYVQRRADYWKTIDYFNPESQQKGSGYYDNPENLPVGVTKEQWVAYDPSFSGNYTETWLNRLQFNDIEIKNYIAGNTADWRDEIYRTGIRQDYNLAFSGHTPKVNYYTSFGYQNNQGFTVGDNFNVVRGRVNLETNITDWLKIGTNTQFANRSDNDVTANTGNADVISPFGDIYEEDGTIKRYPTNDARIANPLLAHFVDDYFYRVQTLNSTIFARMKLPLGVSLQTNVNNRFGWRKDYYFNSDIKYGITAGGQASRNNFSDYEWLIDNILNWNYSFTDKHRIDAIFVVSSEKYQFWDSKSSNEGFVPNSNLGFHNLNAGINPMTQSNDEVQTGNAILGRINYYLMNRYLLTASLRKDGFSAFGINNPYGTYPAFAGAWQLSEEPFLRNMKQINNLKLRISWGESGNRDIGRYVALSKLNVTDNIIDGENVKGVWTDNLANSDLKWERTRATNIGLDFSLFNNRISSVIDVYYNKTTDLILSRSLPTIIGYSSVIANLGQVDNKGLEITVSSLNIDIPKRFRWETSLMFSTNKNIIRHLYGDMVNILDEDGNVIGEREDDDVQNNWYIGHSIHDIYDYKMIGIWQLGEEEDAKKYGKQPGDPKLLDIDEDGKMTQNDKVWQGTLVPKYRASLRSSMTLFENIDFSFLLRGEFNYWAVDNMPRNEDNRYFDRSNSIKTEYWMPDNPSNKFARLGSNSSNPTVNIYKRRDYLRLQNASFSYRVPSHLLTRYSIESLRVSANVDNAFVITNWTYFDPENRERSPFIFTMGFDISF